MKTAAIEMRLHMLSRSLNVLAVLKSHSHGISQYFSDISNHIKWRTGYWHTHLSMHLPMEFRPRT